MVDLMVEKQDAVEADPLVDLQEMHSVDYWAYQMETKTVAQLVVQLVQWSIARTVELMVETKAASMALLLVEWMVE